ncbi:MAG: hypothetical protein IKI34_03590 [Eubacterium sp.]|nr:hypothetical protein [Eubacterium sp.]
MQLTNLSNKEIKEISEKIAPKLLNHPFFMYYCKSEKDREGFIKDYFNYYLRKWIKSEIVLTDEGGNVIITLISIENFHSKDKGMGLAKLKRNKSAYANVTYHQGNILYLSEIVAPAKIGTKIMMIFSTLKYRDEAEELIDEAIEIAKANNYMLVYETFSKKAGEILGAKDFEVAYEKLFQGTQFFETIMTYYLHDKTKPVKLVEEFHPITIHDDTLDNSESSEEKGEKPEV